MCGVLTHTHVDLYIHEALWRGRIYASQVNHTCVHLISTLRNQDPIQSVFQMNITSSYRKY